jgi:hypothetical protein
MICPNCGREARGKFCTTCGTQLTGESPSSDPGATSVINQADVRDPNTTSVIRPEEVRDPNVTSAIYPAAMSDPDMTSVIRPADVRDPDATSAVRQSDVAWHAEAQSGLDQTRLETLASADPYPATATQPMTATLVQPDAMVATRGGRPGGYPAQVQFDVPPASSRFWAIPLLGILAKFAVLIPHIVCLYLLGLAVGVLQLVLWIPVLFTGRYPEWGTNLVGGTIRWGARVQSYFYGLTDEYPPFGLADSAYPVRVSFQVPPFSNRLWAVPVVGILIKLVILVPHLIIVYALGAVVGALQLVIWAFVLFGGRYPEWGYELVGGYIRWYVRVVAYLFGLNDQYPPFQLAG